MLSAAEPSQKRKGEPLEATDEARPQRGSSQNLPIGQAIDLIEDDHMGLQLGYQRGRTNCDWWSWNLGPSTILRTDNHGLTGRSNFLLTE